jgi:hypothetical protein
MAQISSTQFKSITAALYADNVTGDIGANDLRTQMDNVADSAVFKITGRTTSPLTTDDGANTSGNGVFRIGDVWVNETLDKAFMCVDNATNNAKWTEITFTDAASLVAAGGPAPDEIPVFSNPTTINSSNGRLLWNGTNMTVDGNIIISGTVDGRDLSNDGAKLDSIPANAIAGVGVTNAPINGGTPSGNVSTAFNFKTGDGLFISFGGSTTEIRIDNNRVINDTANRTLTAFDNGRFITNRGATGPVRWNVPASVDLEDSPRLVATFIKVANQTMEIIGANAVSINGNTEAGGNESLTTICPTPYSSVAFLIYSGLPNTYYLYESNVSKLGQVVAGQVGVWDSDGVITGVPEFTWDGTTLNVSGAIKSRWVFDDQIGTSYTFVLTDQNKIITMDNASPNSVLIPDSTTVDFPIGTEIRVIQVGAGVTTIDSAAIVTLNGVLNGSGAMTSQWGEVRLYKRGANEWIATGAIGAVS